MNWRILFAQLTDITNIIWVAIIAATIVFLMHTKPAEAASLEPMELMGMCTSRGNLVTEIAYFRDNVIPKQVIIDNVKKYEGISDGHKKALIHFINRVYARKDLTADQMYEITYVACMNPIQDI